MVAGTIGVIFVITFVRWVAPILARTGRPLRRYFNIKRHTGGTAAGVGAEIGAIDRIAALAK